MYTLIFTTTSTGRLSLSLPPCLPPVFCHFSFKLLHQMSQMSPTLPYTFSLYKEEDFLVLWNRLLKISASVLKPLYRNHNFGFQCIFIYKTIIEKGKVYMVHRALRKNKFAKKIFHFKHLEGQLLQICPRDNNSCPCKNLGKNILLSIKWPRRAAWKNMTIPNWYFSCWL